MLRNIFIRFLFLIFLTCVLIFLIELFARLIFGLPKQTSADPLSYSNVIPDQVLNHKWKPNSQVVEVGRSIPYTLYINGQSWVSRREIPVEKLANTIRIFYVGDSNTTGPVKEEKKMATVVEQELNK